MDNSHNSSKHMLAHESSQMIQEHFHNLSYLCATHWVHIKNKLNIIVTIGRTFV